jgi:hypothetical protein
MATTSSGTSSTGGFVNYIKNYFNPPITQTPLAPVTVSSKTTPPPAPPVPPTTLPGGGGYSMGTPGGGGYEVSPSGQVKFFSGSGGGGGGGGVSAPVSGAGGAGGVPAGSGLQSSPTIQEVFSSIRKSEPVAIPPPYMGGKVGGGERIIVQETSAKRTPEQIELAELLRQQRAQQNPETASFSREHGYGGRIFITEGQTTRLASGEDYTKYQTTREDIIRATPGELKTVTAVPKAVGIIPRIQEGTFTIEELRKELEQPTASMETRYARGATPTFRNVLQEVGLGVSSSVLGTAQFIKNPEATLKSAMTFAGDILTGGAAGSLEKPFKQLTTSPAYLAGYVGAEIAQGYLTDVAVKPVLKTGYNYLFSEKPVKEIPTLAMQEAVEPFTRQRATVLLQDESGKYILGRTKTGEVISIGGGIEAGQTPRIATLAELSQETGLKLKDITDFQFQRKFVFPEETYYVYTGKVKDVSKIVPSSDIAEIVTISPSKAKGVTGQSAFYPVTKGGVRTYELSMINYLESGAEPTWLSAVTTTGEKYYLGTQSRYDVPFSEQKKFLKEEKLVLAHGTPEPAVLKKFDFTSQKEFDIKVEKGLFVQPPVSTKGSPGYVGLSYVDIGKTQESLGLKLGIPPKRAVFTFVEKPVYPITTTQKTILGIEEELIIRSGTIRTTAKATPIFLGGERVWFQPVKILKSGEKVLTSVSSVLEKSEAVGRYTYINPLSFTPSLLKSEQTTSYSKPSISSNLFVSLPKMSESRSLIEPVKERIRNVNFYPAGDIVERRTNLPSATYPKEIYGREIEREFFKQKKIFEPPINPPNRPSVFVSYFETGKRNKPSVVSSVPTYSVLLRKKGKFVPFATNLPREKALQFGSERALTDIARTFKIVKTGKTMDIGVRESSFMPSETKFRQYKVRKGKAIATPNIFVQRTSANLQSSSERAQLAEARRISRLLSGGLQ